MNEQEQLTKDYIGEHFNEFIQAARDVGWLPDVDRRNDLAIKILWNHELTHSLPPITIETVGEYREAWQRVQWYVFTRTFNTTGDYTHAIYHSGLIPEPERLAKEAQELLLYELYLTHLKRLGVSRLDFAKSSVNDFLQGFTVADIFEAWEKAHFTFLRFHFESIVDNQPGKSESQGNSTNQKPSGRPTLLCNIWAQEEAKKGRTIRELLAEYDQRHQEETGRVLADVRSSLKSAIKGIFREEGGGEIQD